MLLILLLIVNGAISWFNAWACGQAWTETKRQGGWAHLVNWSAAIMSVCGFTWIYLILIALLGTTVTRSHDVDGQAIQLVTPQMFLYVFELGYTLIIIPIIGSGLVLTLNSWAHFYRERTFGSGAVAAWNTFAQVHNMYEAVRVMPSIWKDLGNLFGGSTSTASGSGSSAASGASSNNKVVQVLIVVAIALLAIVLAILTTSAILRSSARSHARKQLEQAATA